MNEYFVVIHGTDGKLMLVNLEQIVLVDVTDNGLDLHLSGNQRVFVSGQGGTELGNLLRQRCMLPNGAALPQGTGFRF